jgi:hypothetical protein
VEKEFAKEECKLKSNYVNSKTVMDYEYEGQIYHIRWSGWYDGSRPHKPKRVTIKNGTEIDVKEAFRKENCKLLSSFKMANERIKYIHDGVTYTTTWHKWNINGQRIHLTIPTYKKAFMKLLTEFKIQYEMDYMYHGFLLDFYLPEYGYVFVNFGMNECFNSRWNGGKLLNVGKKFVANEKLINWIDECTMKNGNIFDYSFESFEDR